jgi:hypothetical protein
MMHQEGHRKVGKPPLRFVTLFQQLLLSECDLDILS